MTGVVCRHPGGLALTDRLVAASGLRAGAAVLDVGCGAGATVIHLADEHALHMTGIDAAAERTGQAADARPDLRFVTGRAEQLPFPAASFDAALCECVLSTLPVPGRALAEMARVVRPGGVVLASDLYLLAGDEGDRRGGVPSLGSRETVEELFAASGLDVTLWEDEPGALGRYVWDLAALRAPRSRAPERRPAPRPAPRPPARRLGYFICLARRTDG